MYNGLAEQILIELKLAAHSRNISDNKQLRENIAVLSIACGKSQYESNIYDMLSEFSVGTEKIKRSPGIPKSQSIRPLRELNHYQSPENSIKHLITDKDASFQPKKRSTEGDCKS